MPIDFPRIVFMGTPDLAVHILDAIIGSDYNVAGVVTAPDKPAGRGRKLQASPVKHYALEHKLPLLQPEHLKNEDFLRQLELLAPDLQVVVAFRMLPEAVWSLPALGTFNLHASLLPDYRGAAPINRVLMNGEKITGVTTFLIDHMIDTGNILLREEIPVSEYETAGSLHEKVKITGAKIVLQTIKALSEGSIRPVNQDTLITPGKKLNKAPKIYKEDCLIDWNQPCEKAVNLIHGLSPVPGAFCFVEEEDKEPMMIKIFAARCEKEPHRYEAGTLLTDNKKNLRFATPDGFVRVLELQIPGKRKMQTDELLRGFRFSGSNPEKS